MFQMQELTSNEPLSLHEARNLLKEKDATIENLSQQITKYKCSELKSNKLIKQLQEKINQLAPSTNKTDSKFMMPSEFKTYFEQFITNTLSGTLSAYADRPRLYISIFKALCTSTEQKIMSKIQSILSQLCKLFSLPEDAKESLFQSILKILQENWEKIFPFSPTPFKLQIETEELNLTQSQLHTICVYMLLQQKRWEFVHPKNTSTVVFNKKEQICVDGWLKDGQQALFLLQGISRESHLHAGIKPYVLPNSKEDFVAIEILPLLLLTEEKPKSPMRRCISSKISSQISNQVSNQVSNQMAQNCRDLSKCIKVNSERDAKRIQLCEFVAFQKPKKEITRKLKSPNNFEEKYSILKEEVSSKKKSIMNNAKIVSVLSDSDDIRRKREELPLKKSKANTSRKNSVGKIVTQNLNSLEMKENNPNRHNKSKVYRDMIKEKLGDVNSSGLNRSKRKEENRPLKISNHISKLREKYVL